MSSLLSEDTQQVIIEKLGETALRLAFAGKAMQGWGSPEYIPMGAVEIIEHHIFCPCCNRWWTRPMDARIYSLRNTRQSVEIEHTQLAASQCPHLREELGTTFRPYNASVFYDVPVVAYGISEKDHNTTPADMPTVPAT